MINILVDNIYMFIIALFGFPLDSLFEYGNMRIVFISIAKITQLFFYYFVIRLSNWRKTNESLFAAIPLLLCQVFSVFICHIMYLAVYRNDSFITMDFAIAAAGVLYINVIIFLYIERIKSAYEIKKQNELAEQQFKSELEYFQQLKEDQEETRALWHDIAKYLNTMKSLIDVNEIEHARECVEQATEVFSNLGHVVDVGNTVVSAVLNQRVQKARRQSIPIDLDVRVTEEINISSPDLSIIIGNTFDNALEACELLPKELRHISICIIQKEKLLFYEIENSFSQEASAAKRAKKKVQGYGLKNVKRCVDKYKGEMMIDKSDGIFRVSIHLNTLKKSVA
jgi:sensor histidine kinase YesM